MTMHHPRNEPSPWSRFFVEDIEFGHEYTALQKLRMAGNVIYSGEAKRKQNGGAVDGFPAWMLSMRIAHIATFSIDISRGLANVIKQPGHDYSPPYAETLAIPQFGVPSVLHILFG